MLAGFGERKPEMYLMMSEFHFTHDPILGDVRVFPEASSSYNMPLFRIVSSPPSKLKEKKEWPFGIFFWRTKYYAIDKIHQAYIIIINAKKINLTLKMVRLENTNKPILLIDDKEIELKTDGSEQSISHTISRRLGYTTVELKIKDLPDLTNVNQASHLAHYTITDWKIE